MSTDKSSIERKKETAATLMFKLCTIKNVNWQKLNSVASNLTLPLLAKLGTMNQ